jgi:hypothetical protein
MDLSIYEKKYFSQNGEDGIINKIFETINTTNKYYVEFGVEDGSECNTKYLRSIGWSGLMMDGSNENLEIGLHKEYITYDNIISLFNKYNVPKYFDLLSIDIDYNNFYVLYKILNNKNFKPRVIISECSAWYNNNEVVIYDPNYSWDYNKSSYVGASVYAYNDLLKLFGYTIIYNDKSSVNLFAVLNKYAHYFKKYNNLTDILIKPNKKINLIAFIDDFYKRYTISSKSILNREITVKTIVRINDRIIKFIKSNNQIKTDINKLIEINKTKNWKLSEKLRNKITLEIYNSIKLKPIFHDIIYTLIINKIIILCKGDNI